MARRWRVLIACFLVLLIQSAIGMAQSPEGKKTQPRDQVQHLTPPLPGVAPSGVRARKKSIDGLRRLNSLRLAVDDSFAKYQVDISQLRANAEIRLRGVGIQIVAGADSLSATASPTLEMNLVSIKDQGNEAYFVVNARLVEEVTATRNPSIKIQGTTWRDERIVSMAGKMNKSELLKLAMDSLIEELVRDRAAANRN
jgi:hypothetical protein